MAGSRQGVMVVGSPRSESGMGAVSRALLPVFRALGEPATVVERSLGDPALREEHPFSPEGSTSPSTTPDVAVVVENADSIAASFSAGELDVVGDMARVAYWCWEVDRFPRALVPPAGLVDEIWTLSEHTARAIRPMVDVPVLAVPPAIDVRRQPPRSRSELGLRDDEFVVVFTFDARPGAKRKNPEGAIEAYLRAFDVDDGCRLVLKSINVDSQAGLGEALRSCVGDRPDIELRDGYVTADLHADLIASCDVYLSLHRAEGFGFTMAEAMAAGRAVVGTGWSGNLEFMSDDTARLVGYELVDVPPDAFPWPVDDAHWAEPDLDAAAAALRELRDDASAARTLGERARAAMLAHHSGAARARLVAERLGDLRARRVQRTAVLDPLRAAIEAPVPLLGKRPARTLQRWLDRAQARRREAVVAAQREAVDAIATSDRALRARVSALELEASGRRATAEGGGTPAAAGDATPT